jgi:hypothetical protein
VISRWGLVIVAFVVGSAAHADCVLDRKIADLATDVYAFNNICTEQPDYDDNGAVDVFVALGAAAETSKTDLKCRAVISHLASQASAQLQMATRSERSAECAMYRASPDVQAAIRRLGRSE